MMLSTAKDNPGIYGLCNALFLLIMIEVLSSTRLAEHHSLTFSDGDNTGLLLCFLL